ncbi:PREDICTED: uncharacterized protein LOC109590330 [Amphimedon queenslandica]|uniref:Uncharacterized protein n=1 Tax=Amphimedon queenslandica TaxID=400682 RepID=A0AAN0JXX6_AMPQE|nr:PREDICTED: uncharacterized protein LOC109590330 [Amphimedon queenslandica]|eukprot:XP_019861806.1 PREDICTED: uncharacterized protein LOC109590330 [Amphimedon queenslandica]
MYNTSDTTLHINSSDLFKNVTYTYTVKRCQHCSISKPFTLAPIEVMSVTIDTTNATDSCKNDSCCANVTLSIILESSDMCLKHPSQNYEISYNSNTEDKPVTFKINETEWTESLEHNETYCFTVIPINDFITGEPINNDTNITEYQCKPPGNGNNGSNGGNGGCGTWCIIEIIFKVIGFIVVIVGIIFIIIILIILLMQILMHLCN